MNEMPSLYCPSHQTLLSNEAAALVCEKGCRFPITNGIPRFTGSSYADSFGLQWNKFRTTQLDSVTGAPISKDRLTRMVGGDLTVLDGKTVLEAGCGAGRFSEVFLNAGAKLFAADISSAVEANLQNCGHYPNYFICQADIRYLPVPPCQFDVVACIGVIQHTPSPEETIAALCHYLRPGGMLVIDHYSFEYPMSAPRRHLRSALLKTPSGRALKAVGALTTVLWPIHKLLWDIRKTKGFTRLRHAFLKISPIVDYHDAYPQLDPATLAAWATLDTHDLLTDHYKHLRSEQEIRKILTDNGMLDIQTANAGNGVEARAFKANV